MELAEYSCFFVVRLLCSSPPEQTIKWLQSRGDAADVHLQRFRPYCRRLNVYGEPGSEVQNWSMTALSTAVNQIKPARLGQDA